MRVLDIEPLSAYPEAHKGADCFLAKKMVK